MSVKTIKNKKRNPIKYLQKKYPNYLSRIHLNIC